MSDMVQDFFNWIGDSVTTDEWEQAAAEWRRQGLTTVPGFPTVLISDMTEAHDYGEASVIVGDGLVTFTREDTLAIGANWLRNNSAYTDAMDAVEDAIREPGGVLTDVAETLGEAVGGGVQQAFGSMDATTKTLVGGVLVLGVLGVMGFLFVQVAPFLPRR